MEDGRMVWAGSRPDLSTVNMLLIPPAWTLSLDLAFYAAAPWLVRQSNKTLIFLIAASLGLKLACWFAGLREDPWTYRFLPFEAAYFIAGIISYRIYASGKVHAASLRIACATVLATIMYQPVAVAVEVLGGPRPIVGIAYHLILIVGMPALFLTFAASRLDRWLGDLSYRIYLVHWPLLSLMHSVAPELPQWTHAPVLLLASAAAGFMLWRCEPTVGRLLGGCVRLLKAALAAMSISPVSVRETRP